MGHRPVSKMPVSERAKQFAPFSALGGLEQALKKKEEEAELKAEGKTGDHTESSDTTDEISS